MSDKVVLGLDLSTSTGFTILSKSGILSSGCIEHKIENFNVNAYPNLSKGYPINIMFVAEQIAIDVLNLVLAYSPDKVFIENTVRGRNRHTQRALEWIHFAVVKVLQDRNTQFQYVDPTEWRSNLGLRLSAEDKKHNKEVKLKKAKGKITYKHLSVRYCNNNYSLNFKLKDNDIADSLCIAEYGLSLVQGEK